MTLSYRISPFQYLADDQFERLLDLLRAHRPAVDEISLFNGFTHHLYQPLDDYARTATVMARRLDQLRRAGIASVGINVLCTIGHLDEAWDFWKPLPFDAMMGHDGQRSRSCACPTSPEFLAYVRALYRLTAQARPDFIWIDDDVRMQHHTVAWPCFCPRCLARFARRHPQAPTGRRALVKLLDSPRAGPLRAAWIRNNEQVLNQLLGVAARAVRQVSPRIKLGLMTCGIGWGSYSGQDYARWLRTLGARKTRPGGGFYGDYSPSDMIPKAIGIARQCVTYRGQATDVQYELENFPYQKLDKSVQTVVNECTLALAAGCNGVAFNALNDLARSMDDYRDLLRAIERQRPLWEQFVAAARGLPLAGLWPAWNLHLMARRQVRGDWFGYADAYSFDRAVPLAGLGLPLTLEPKAACATILSGRVAELFTTRELKAMLAGGLLMDVATLGVLRERGLDHLAGVKVVRAYDNGVWETLTPHAINGPFAGDSRDIRTSFGNELSYVLASTAAGVQDLAHLTGYDGSGRGSCLAAFENPLGGRVVTMGYGPWGRLASTPKRWQLLGIADWISRGRLPVRIDRTLRVTPLVRLSHDRRRVAAVLLNGSFDPTGRFDLRLRAAAKTIHLLTPRGRRTLPTRRDGQDLLVAIPSIPPWQTAVFVGA